MIDSEEYMLAPDGGKLWIATTKVPLRNERGEVIGVIGVSRDVTRRRLADAMREGQAGILEMIVSGAPLESVLEELVHLDGIAGERNCRLHLADRRRTARSSADGVDPA